MKGIVIILMVLILSATAYADDAAYIQSLLDNANGACVTLDAVVYNTATTINLDPGDCLEGAGIRSTYFIYNGTGAVFSAKGTAPAQYGMTLKEFTIISDSPGTIGIIIDDVNFATLDHIKIAGGPTKNLDKAVEIKSTTHNTAYFTRLQRSILQTSKIGLVATGGYTNEVTIDGGHIAECDTGVKADGSTVKFTVVDLEALGTAIHVLNNGVVQSYGSRFEFMDIAYKNEGTGNQITSIGDIIASTNVNHDFYDGVGRNIKGVVSKVPSYGLSTEDLSRGIRITQSPATLTLHNDQNDAEATLSTHWNWTDTFVLRLDGVKQLVFGQNDKYKIGTSSPSLSWNYWAGGSCATGDRVYNTAPSKQDGKILVGWYCIDGVWEPGYVSSP